MDAVCRLVSINSVEGEGAPGAPFGRGPAAALDEALNLAQSWGLITQNHEGYVGTADLNDLPDALHLLCHLDVVAPGEGWTVTKPFSPQSDGRHDLWPGHRRRQGPRGGLPAGHEGGQGSGHPPEGQLPAHPGHQ